MKYSLLCIFGVMLFAGCTGALPDRCNTGADVSCTQYQKTGGLIEFTLQNNLEDQITINEITLRDETQEYTCTVSPQEIPNQATTQVRCTAETNSNLYEIQGSYEIEGYQFARPLQGDILVK